MASKITKDQIRAALEKQGTPKDRTAQLLGETPTDSSGVPFGFWDDARVPGASPDEAELIKARLRQQQLDASPEMARQMFGPDAAPEPPLEPMQTFPPSGPSPRFAPSAPEKAEPAAVQAQAMPPSQPQQGGAMPLYAASGPSPRMAASAPVQGNPAAVLAQVMPASGPAPAMPPQPKRNPDRLDDMVALAMRGQ